MERTSVYNLHLLTCAYDINLVLERDHPVIPHDTVIYAEHVSELRTLVVERGSQMQPGTCYA
jgi:hypothetical protein